MEDKNSPAVDSPSLIRSDDQTLDKLGAGWTPSQDDEAVVRILAKDRDRVRGSATVPTADKDAYDVFVDNAPPMSRWGLGALVTMVTFVVAVLLYLASLLLAVWTNRTDIPLLLSLMANTLVIAAVMAPEKKKN